MSENKTPAMAVQNYRVEIMQIIDGLGKIINNCSDEELNLINALSKAEQDCATLTQENAILTFELIVKKDRIAKLESTLVPEAPINWKEASTPPPKDGTTIAAILWETFLDKEYRDLFALSYNTSLGYWEDSDGGRHDISRMTHWLPLPTMPSMPEKTK